MPEHKKKLEFLTQNDGENWRKPVWKEWDVINYRLSRVHVEDGGYPAAGWLLLRLLVEQPVLLLGELKGG